MAKISFNQHTYESEGEETVLDCLIRHQVDYPHACKSGVCQSCMAELTEGKMEAAWQNGLKGTLAAKNYFLACLAKPSQDLALALPDLNEMTSVARIQQIQKVNENVVFLRLIVDSRISWIPGQYLHLINPEGVRRSYSIANLPEEDGYLELHIKLVPEGAMSRWIRTQARPGVQVRLQGPLGDCFYENARRESFPIILAGTGTGLAPLIAIAREAIRQRHPGKIHLIHGGVTASDLYLDDELKIFSEEREAFIYETCVLKSDGVHQEANITQVLLKALQDHPQARVYLCGPEEMTKKLKTSAFLAGVPSASIYSDPFK